MRRGGHATRPWTQARERLRTFEAWFESLLPRLQALGPEGAAGAAGVPSDPLERVAEIEALAQQVLRDLGQPDQIGYVREQDGSVRPIRWGSDNAKTLGGRDILLHPCLAEADPTGEALAAVEVLMRVRDTRHALGPPKRRPDRRAVKLAMDLERAAWLLEYIVDKLPIIMGALDRDRRERGQAVGRHRPAKYQKTERERRSLHAELREKHPQKPLSDIARLIAERRHTEFVAEYRALKRLGLK